MAQKSIFSKYPKLSAAIEETPELKTKHIKNTQELVDVIDNSKVLQGYPTSDTSCLPVVELINYYVSPADFVSLAWVRHDQPRENSICQVDKVCGPNSTKKFGEVFCVIEYLTVSKGNNCFFGNNEYQHIPYLIPRVFDLLDVEPVDINNRDMSNEMLRIIGKQAQGNGIKYYCLYGDKEHYIEQVHTDL